MVTMHCIILLFFIILYIFYLKSVKLCIVGFEVREFLRSRVPILDDSSSFFNTMNYD